MPRIHSINAKKKFGRDPNRDSSGINDDPNFGLYATHNIVGEDGHQAGDIWQTKDGKWAAKSEKDIQYFPDRKSAGNHLDQVNRSVTPLKHSEDPYLEPEFPAYRDPETYGGIPTRFGKTLSGEDPFGDELDLSEPDPDDIMMSRYINKELDPSDPGPEGGYDVLPDDEDIDFPDPPAHRVSPDLPDENPVGLPVRGKDYDVRGDFRNYPDDPYGDNEDVYAPDDYLDMHGSAPNDLPPEEFDEPDWDAMAAAQEPDMEEPQLHRYKDESMAETRHGEGDVWRISGNRWASKNYDGKIRYFNNNKDAVTHSYSEEQEYTGYVPSKIKTIENDDPDPSRFDADKKFNKWVDKQYAGSKHPGFGNSALSQPPKKMEPNWNKLAKKQVPIMGDEDEPFMHRYKDESAGDAPEWGEKRQKAPVWATTSGKYGATSPKGDTQTFDDMWSAEKFAVKNDSVQIPMLSKIMRSEADKGFQKAQKIVPTYVKQMDKPFKVVTKEGPITGKAGDYLAKSGNGDEEWAIDKDVFERDFEIVEGVIVERNYRREYDKYQGTPEQKKRRAQRNKDRRKFEREGKVSKGDGKDIHHRDGNPFNHDGKNTAIMDKSKNRAMKERITPGLPPDSEDYWNKNFAAGAADRLKGMPRLSKTLKPGASPAELLKGLKPLKKKTQEERLREAIRNVIKELLVRKPLTPEGKGAFDNPKGKDFFSAIRKGAKQSTAKGMSPQDALAKFNKDRLEKQKKDNPMKEYDDDYKGDPYVRISGGKSTHIYPCGCKTYQDGHNVERIYCSKHDPNRRYEGEGSSNQRSTSPAPAERSKDALGNTTIKCPKCGKYFSSSSDYNKHHEYAHMVTQHQNW